MGLFGAFQDSGFVPYPKFSIGFYVFLPLLYFFWISCSFSSTAILLFRPGLIAHSYQMGAAARFWVEWRAWIRDFDWPLQGLYTVESWLDRSKGKAGNPVGGLQQVEATEKTTVVWTRAVETAIDPTHKDTLEVGLRRPGASLAAGREGRWPIDLWAGQLGECDNAQTPEWVSLRAEEGLEEGDEFGSGQSFHCLAFTTQWKGRWLASQTWFLANCLLASWHVKFQNMSD